MEKEEIIRKVEEVISIYNPDGLSPFPFHSIESDKNDLEIVFSDLNENLKNRVSGAIFYDKDKESFVIVVNKSHSPNRKNFTIAHELGHYFLHQDTIKGEEILVDGDIIFEGKTLFRLTTTESNRLENEANNFAAELLMPRDKIIKAYNEIKDIEKCAKIFNVSVIAMTIRLTVLSLIKE